MTTEQVSQYLTACRTRQTELPSEFTDTLCSCTVREVPRRVSREDLEALAHEADNAKKQQLILKSGPMRHVVAQCFSEALDSLAVSNPEARAPLVPVSNGLALTNSQRNQFLTACRAPANNLPWAAMNTLCSCIIRETPIWVPREDVEAIGRETDEKKQFQIAFNSRPLRHVMAMCVSEAIEGSAASN
ncbi:MAG TPA: hypothetical protein VJN67_08195 [Stellaceae bacterium]|nr:hypothetical protein [Stellaceae bacterium]